MLEKAGISVSSRRIVPDEKDLIAGALRKLAPGHDLIVTTGGTGVAPRDVTPEATRDVIDRELPGFSEAMRAEGLKKTPRAIISRAVAGISGSCLIINLPGSPKGVSDSLAAVLRAIPHTIEMIKGKGAECAQNP
jgi:molybdopterin adenylyltransferase